MDYEQLQQDFKSDIQTIPQLKIPILSAKETYVPLIKLFLKCFFFLFFLTLNSVTFLSFIGEQREWGTGLLAGAAACGLLSLFITFYLSQYIIFTSMVKTSLKTIAFLRKKIKDLTLIFFGIDFVLLNLFLLIGHWTGFLKDFVFAMGFSQAVAIFLALFSTLVISSMEVERLGLGVMLEVVTEFFKHKEKSDSQP